MKPSKLLVRKRSRAARRGEAYIAGYTFPAHIERRVRRRTPQLDEAGWQLVERGLREWFVCCAWRGRTVLGMPSRLVDEAWHEFILDSLSYTRFCQVAFGEYLHHTPDEAMSTPYPLAGGWACGGGFGDGGSPGGGGAGHHHQGHAGCSAGGDGEGGCSSGGGCGGGGCGGGGS
jgi:hypothetical protein